MRFVLTDRIVELKSGESLTALKNLSLAEEYLADHFPGFPVMPGVLMLESLTQAGAWLVREMEDFAHSIIPKCPFLTRHFEPSPWPPSQRHQSATDSDRSPLPIGTGRVRSPEQGWGAPARTRVRRSPTAGSH